MVSVNCLLFTTGAFRKLYHTDSCSLVKALLVMPFCAPSPAAPGCSCPFTFPRYNYATEVVRQVVGQQTGSDNWLETSGCGTCGVRQVVGDNWRKHGWLATPGLSHLDYTASPKTPTLYFFERHFNYNLRPRRCADRKKLINN